jgi:small-conductance mechanosensitive channel
LLSHPIFTLGTSPVSVMSIIFFIIVIYGSSFLTKMVSEFLNRDVYPKTSLNRGVQDVINTFLKYFIVAVGIIIGLQVNGINLSVFATIGAGLMVGIGFGLQNIANNFVSGIIILLERPVKVGDFVEIENISGEVVEISSRSTRIKNNQNIIMIVPNSKFVSESVINWSHNNDIVKLQIPIDISYNADPEHVKSILLEIAANHPNVLDKPKSDVHFLEFGESALKLMLLVWVDVAFKRYEIVSDINFEIYKKFKEEKIKIPYPQLDIHLQEKKQLS